MNNDQFRNIMGSFATGITVISTENKGDTYGMTANAFISVSLNPKLILVSIANTAKILNPIKQTEKFAVSFLSTDQEKLSMRFSGQIKEAKQYKFEWYNNQPVISNALANITCDVYEEHVAGDHTLLVGKVTALRSDIGEPLLYFQGKYRKIKNMI